MYTNTQLLLHLRCLSCTLCMTAVILSLLWLTSLLLWNRSTRKQGEICYYKNKQREDSLPTFLWIVTDERLALVRSKTGRLLCFPAQRWQRFTCHLLQCTASLWSTASTSRPTIETHVSAEPSWTAWRRITHVLSIFFIYIWVIFSLFLQHFVPCFA